MGVFRSNPRDQLGNHVGVVELRTPTAQMLLPSKSFRAASRGQERATAMVQKACATRLHSLRRRPGAGDNDERAISNKLGETAVGRDRRKREAFPADRGDCGSTPLI